MPPSLILPFVTSNICMAKPPAADELMAVCGCHVCQNHVTPYFSYSNFTSKTPNNGMLIVYSIV